ncbi:MAG TPA: type 2 lanthipeptide synthetase LanM, partial [Planctomycetia bacterium]|nr:type 2 lanthipeptide synthetase LanM [Planctomycetia bacterium]
AHPFIADARRQLRRAAEQSLADFPGAPVTAAEFDDMIATALIERAMQVVGRTMILELNVARVTGALEGKDSAERFISFARQCADPKRAMEIFQEYPVMARQLARTCRQWAETGAELFDRLCRDWGRIETTFFGGDAPRKLIETSIGAGDTHRGGRTVAVLKFEDGRKLVYKPRSLAVDRAFGRMLSWVNGKRFPAPFRPLHVIDRGEYGWTEFVARADCEDAAAARRFYVRQGGVLALMHALCGNDLHEENLIAAGEQPVLIDLETLFVAPFPANEAEAIDARAGRIAGTSVVRVGLLPSPGANGGLDLSGLGSTENRLTPHPMLVLDNDGTDEMRMERRRVKMEGSDNVPAVGGAKMHAADYKDAILEGFETMYRLLATHRDECLAADGPLANFRGAEVRIVLRGTQTYGRMLQESHHPDLLRDALERDRFFDRLWVDVKYRPDLERVIVSERKEMEEGDIPCFVADAASRDLVGGSGIRFPDFFDKSGMQFVRERIAGMGEEDLRRQTWFIRAAMAGPDAPTAPLPSAGVKSTDAEGRFTAAAADVGDRLAK